MDDRRRTSYEREGYGERPMDHLEPRKTHEKPRKPKRRRHEKKIVEKTSFIFSLIIILAFLVWIGLSVFRGMNAERIAVVDITLGSVSTPKEFDSIIVRDEHVYTSTNTGELQYAVVEGDRVSKNGVVAYVSDSMSQMYYDEAMKQLDNEDLTVKSLMENYNGSKEYINNLNESIKNKIDSRNYSSFSDYYALIESVEYTVDLRNSYLLSGSENFDLDAYDENIGKSRTAQYATNSGIVSYNLDGYEEQFTVEDFSVIKESDTKLTNSNTQNILTSIEAGQKAFKVIEDNNWYIVTYMNNDYITENAISKDKQKKIYIHNGYQYNEYSAVVHSVTEEGNKSQVVYRLNTGINDMLDIRFTKLKTENDVHEGYKIPASAIEHKDTISIKDEFIYTTEEDVGNETYVYFSKQDGTVEKIMIDILRSSTTPGYSEILTQNTILTAGDILVKEDNYEKEFQIPKLNQIDGVLVVNTGVAFFREVFIDTYVEEGSSTVLLKVEDNPNITQYDKIVEDASLAQEGDVIY